MKEEITIEGIEGIFTQILVECNKLIEFNDESRASTSMSQEQVELSKKSSPTSIQDPHITHTKDKPRDGKGKGNISRMLDWRTLLRCLQAEKRRNALFENCLHMIKEIVRNF